MGQDIGHRIATAALACVAMMLAFACQAAVTTLARDALPQQKRFIRFGAEQGLSSTINDLTIDQQGYVWVATGDGLARYDGTKFRYWRRIVGDTASLPDNEVTLLHVDVHDRLWAATWFALSVLDADYRVPRTINFRGDAARCGIDITAMTSAPDGVVWIGNHAGDLCRIGLDGKISRLHPEQNETSFLRGSIPLAMVVMRSGSLLIGSDTGLWRVEPGDLNKRPVPLHRDRTRNDAVFILSPQRDGHIWVGAESGLFLLDSEAQWLPLPWLPPKLSRRAAVLNTRDGAHWIGTYNGLYRRNVGADVVFGMDQGYGIDSGVIRMAEDQDGGVWIVSNSEGILYISKQKGLFLSAMQLSSLSGDNIVSVDIDSKIGAIALTADGLYTATNSKKIYKFIESNSMGLEEPRAVRICDQQRVLVADSYGVLNFNATMNNVKRIQSHHEKNYLRRPEAISCSIDGRLWVSIFGGGILIYSKEGHLLQEFLPEETLGEEAEAFIDLRFSPDGVPWYSDGHDLRRLDKGRFVRVPLPPGEYVYSLDFASAQQLWVARFGSLERYEWDGIKLHLRERVGAEQGLPSVEVRSVMVAKAGNIWLNTVRGLVQYNTRQRRARIFGLRDGLPGLDFTLDTLRRQPNGPAIAFSKEGIVLFDPDRPLPAPRASVVAVEAIELRRGEDTVRFARRSGIVLRAVMRPGDRDLRVAARVVSFADPETYRYRFKLMGYDPDWVGQGDRGERVFSSLPPGRYLLEMQGANADGVWSATRQVEILVEAPWWRRWWAWMCYAILAAVLLYWAAYLYRQRLKRRHEYQLITQKREVAEQASQAKSRFLANLGHEVRTPMTGVLGMSELLLSTSLDSKQKGQVRAIRHAGEHLLRLVNDALDLARIEAGRLELEVLDFDLEAMVEDAIALMRSLADRKGLALRVEFAQDARGGWRGDPTRIRQILLNLLSNALKFTERGEVALSIRSASPHGLSLTVSDTGPGLDTEQQQRLFRRFEQAEGARTASRYGGSGLGLAICQELAVAMGGGIELHSTLGEGASFFLQLPLERVVTTNEHAQLRSRADEQIARDVLLVEDDAIVADVLIGMLQAQGHWVVHTAHALAAMAEIATRSFDIALLDLDLPGMDGLALARHLRGQGWTLPMIAITARADSSAELEAKAAGFNAFLRKPLAGGALADALDDVLAKHWPDV